MEINKNLQEINMEHIHVSRGLNQQAGTASFFYPSEMVREIEHPHPLPLEFCTLCYYLSGSGYYELSDDTIVPFSPGTLIVWGLKQRRRLQHHEAGLYVEKYLRFSSSFYPILQEFKLCGDSFSRMQIDVDAELCRKFDKLANELDVQTERKLPTTALRIFEFVVDLLLNPPSNDGTHIHAMELAAHLLESDLDKPLAMREVAKRLHMGYSTFQHLFTKYYSVSPAQYRIRKKIERIQQMLSCGKSTLNELSIRFGYSNSFALSKQFKKYTGYSPKEYRINQNEFQIHSDAKYMVKRVHKKQ